MGEKYENNRYEKWAVRNRIIGKFLSILGASLVENHAYMHGYGREVAECFFALWSLKG